MNFLLVSEAVGMTHTPHRVPLPAEDEITSDILRRVSGLYRLAAIGEATEEMVAESAATKAAAETATKRAEAAETDASRLRSELANTRGEFTEYRREKEVELRALSDQLDEQTALADRLGAELADVRDAAEAEKQRLLGELSAVRAEVEGAFERGRAAAQAEFPPMLRLAAQEAERDAKDAYAAALSSVNRDQTTSAEDAEGILRDALIDSPSTYAWGAPRLEARQ